MYHTPLIHIQNFIALLDLLFFFVLVKKVLSFSCRFNPILIFQPARKGVLTLC